MATLRSLYLRFEGLLASCKSPLLLVIRLYWGFQFMQDGWGKLHNLAKVTDYFTSLHLPLPGLTATGVGSLELVGGLLLILGLFSRGIATILAINMIVAFVAGDREALATAFSSDPTKFYSADPFTYLCASLLIAVLGAGAFSLDHFLFKRGEPSAL